ncbi:hypothetical protein PTSG_04106 [Salpingoeca rosetta]|uniref:Septin-type G domain-containing protein n=1 Tax=Salpingoeca rosetta (strain ATCC 50818 / BSB-021) TaxID=946362 RepID=F2U6L7_SALR5|nr:uncharacterized protein PTSG_04106 [Salpingoeca rosetta]EGD83499.1 hypothetical protein PTSG_04106 [Salpingoeca rosetta]|eukprot:XP_004995003.1 hypothetical protein PTSG_04106 [Salpingoeca rosetta]
MEGGSQEVLYAPDDVVPAHTVSLTASDTITIARAFEAALSDDDAAANDQTLKADDVVSLVASLLGEPVSDNIMEFVLDRTEGMDRVDFKTFLHLFTEVLLQTTEWGKLKKQPASVVGFHTYGDQMQRQILHEGVNFNIILVGASGLGKSTFVDTLFKSSVSWRANANPTGFGIPSTVQIHTLTHVLEEKSMRVKLSITDTPGFADAINNADAWQPICDFIDAQHSAFLDAELAVERDVNIPDTRVHACIYFIEPTGHGLSELDMQAMLSLQERVNLVPVIAKADTLTRDELEHFKQRIREDMTTANILPFPQSRPTQSESQMMAAVRLLEEQPFGIVGQNFTDPDTGVRGRKTRFGVVEIDNSEHCDFSKLQDMLIRTHMHDLRMVTREVHYENYRRRNLEPPPSQDDGSVTDDFDQQQPPQQQAVVDVAPSTTSTQSKVPAHSSV